VLEISSNNLNGVLMIRKKWKTLLVFVFTGLFQLHAADLSVNTSTHYQTIRGFGGGIAYYGG
jgi:O-glycosyl hydrolase